jgi:F-type H+-transporting ATPase subunit gamma
MAQIRDIKNRMVAVGTIERITKTMQMIATAKFTAAVQRAKATKPFTQTIRRLVGELADAAGDLEHPLIVGPSSTVGKELVLVIASDRGLCGAYNAHVLRKSLQNIRAAEEKGVDVTVESSGKKAVGFFRFAKVRLAEQHLIGDKPVYEDVERIATRYIDAFSKGEYDAVRVGYMRYESNARQIPEFTQLLPMKPEAIGGDEKRGPAAGYELSPSGPELLADLLPLAIKVQLFQAFNDAVVSEQIMRMIAMKSATENAKDLKRTLNRDYNRARQAQITTELTEIIGGTAALE